MQFNLLNLAQPFWKFHQLWSLHIFEYAKSKALVLTDLFYYPLIIVYYKDIWVWIWIKMIRPEKIQKI